jgi:hypothetical protein
MGVRKEEKSHYVTKIVGGLRLRDLRQKEEERKGRRC